MGGNFYECVKNPTDELPWGHCLFCCILFLNMQDESSWIICNPHPLFFSKIFSLTEVFLAGRCLLMVPAMGISLCASSCTKNPQRGKGFSLLYQPSPRPSPPQQASASFPPSTEGSISFDMRSCHFTFSFPLPGLSWRRRNGRETVVFSSLQLPVKGSSHLCALAALEREGWETIKHLSPNYSPTVRALLSCSGYSHLTVWVVWLAEAADFKAIALSCINASNPNPSSSELPGPNEGTAPQWRGGRGSPQWHYFCGEEGERDLKFFTPSY